MSLRFNENLSPQSVHLLSAKYAGCEHVRSFGLASADDGEVWNIAAGRGSVIVTKDADFQHRALLYGPPPKVIWVRIGNQPTQAVVQLLAAHQADVEAFLSDPAAGLLVLP